MRRHRMPAAPAIGRSRKPDGYARRCALKVRGMNPEWHALRCSAVYRSAGEPLKFRRSGAGLDLGGPRLNSSVEGFSTRSGSSIQARPPHHQSCGSGLHKRVGENSGPWLKSAINPPHVLGPTAALIRFDRGGGRPAAGRFRGRARSFNPEESLLHLAGKRGRVRSKNFRGLKGHSPLEL